MAFGDNKRKAVFVMVFSTSAFGFGRCFIIFATELGEVK